VQLNLHSRDLWRSCCSQLVAASATPSFALHLGSNINSRSSSNLLMQGEAVTWQKLSAIQAACDVELTFDRCLAMVKAAEAQVNSWI
jgi:hypothetical protein